MLPLNNFDIERLLEGLVCIMCLQTKDAIRSESKKIPHFKSLKELKQLNYLKSLY